MAATDELRPSTWDSFIGQEAMKEQLRVHIDSAIIRRQTMEHVFLSGAPGTGKTSLAELIALELSKPFETVTMPISSAGLLRLLKQFSGVLLLDEIHRGSDKQTEELLPLLEFGYLRQTNGRKFFVEDLTVIGATTEKQKVIEPLRDRFKIQPYIAEYTDPELARIVMGMAVKCGLRLDEATAEMYGRAAAGTPRRALMFVLAHRDLLITTSRTPLPLEVLDFCQTSPDGLTMYHIGYMKALDKLGGRAGLPTICAMLNEAADSVRRYEQLLVNMELVSYTDRGRELTQAGYRRLAA